MKIKRMTERGLAVLLAAVMMLAAVVPAAGAISRGIQPLELSGSVDSEAGGKAEWNYVSLGDSMSNGLGLSGYGNGGYLEVAPESYPALFAQWLAGGSGIITEGQTEYVGDKGTVHLTQLATSAMRAQDLYYILTYGTEDAFPADEWARTRLLGGADGSTSEGKERWGSDGMVWESTVDTYREAVSEADIITLAVGNGDFGRYLFDILLSETGMPGTAADGDYSYATLENAMRLHGLDEDMQAVVMSVYGDAKSYVSDFLPMEQADIFADRMAYVMANFVVSYSGILDRIAELNPDAEVVVVGMMNTVSSEEDKTLKGELTLGKLVHMLYGYLNQYMAILPAYKQESDPAVYGETVFYYAEADTIECIADEMTDRLADPDSDMRTRLIQSIIGTPDAPGLIWGLLGEVSLVDGFDLVYVTEKQIREYMGYTDFQRALYAVEYPEAAVSIAIYLAFEKTLAEVGNEHTVSLESFAALGNSGADLFGGAIEEFATQIIPAGEPYRATVAEVIAGVANALQTDIVFDVDSVLTIMERNANSEAYIQEVAFLQAMLRIKLELGIDVSVEMLKDLYRNDEEYAGVITQAVDEGKAIVSEMIYEAYDLDGKVDMMCMLLALPDTLSSVLKNDAMAAPLMSLVARCVVADGIGAHPSAEGQAALAEAIQRSYVDGYVVREAVDKSLYSSYTATDSSYYVAIAGPSSAYAELLADALYLDKTTQFRLMSWDNLDYDELLKADLITVGYDETQISSFAINQTLAYIRRYLDVDLRENIHEYVRNTLHVLMTAAKISKLITEIDAGLDSVMDTEPLADKYMVDMDWNALLGEGGQEQVDQLLASIREELLASGIPEEITYSIYVVPYVMDATQGFLSESYIKNKLKDNAYFTVEIPVADLLMYTIESYLYGLVPLQKEYAKVVTTVALKNPSATMVLLGQFNPYAGVTVSLGGASISLDEMYEPLVSGLSGVPMLLAHLGVNIAHVDISAAETFHAASEGAYPWLDVLTDPALTAVTPEGHAYILEQILTFVNTSCGHSYDDCLDTRCHRCGETREAPGHTEGKATCTEAYTCQRCGTVLAEATGHTEVIDEAIAPTCTELGKTAGAHCATCGVTLVRREPVAANGHTWVTDEAVAPDCTADGQTSGKHCSVCDKVFAPQEPIPAPGHTFGEWTVTVEPTVEAEGSEERVCSTCGHTETRATDKLEPETTVEPETEPVTDPETETPTLPETETPALPETETEPATEPETEMPDKQNGCNSVVSWGLALWIVLGTAAVTLKKKEN